MRISGSALLARHFGIGAEHKLFEVGPAGIAMVFENGHSVQTDTGKGRRGDKGSKTSRPLRVAASRCLRVCYFFSCFFQSARNFSIPMSVSGCFTIWSITEKGIVEMCAPASAASRTCRGFRTLATMTSVSYP